MNRREFLGGAALLAACAARAATGGANAEDFDAMWRAIDAQYAGANGRRAAWKRARDAWRPRAAQADHRAGLVLALQGALAFLHDDRAVLLEEAPGSPRRVPAEADIAARWRSPVAVVTAVRAFSEADVAGLHPGHAVTHVDGSPIERVLRERVAATGGGGPEATDWALRHVLAGPRVGTLRLTVRDAHAASLVTIERANPAPPGGPPIIARLMGESRDVGYVRIRNGLADPALPLQLDAALNYLKDARALILDLRDTADGGSPAVGSAILARLVSTPPPMAIVLVDRWTAGEGETLAAALEGTLHATLVGTATAGMRGSLTELRLPHSGIAVSFPAKGPMPVPLRPAVEVDLAAPSGGPGDPILYQALKLSEVRGQTPIR